MKGTLVLTAILALTGCHSVAPHWDRQMDDACENVETQDEFDQASHERQGC